MASGIFSTYRQGENRVTSSILAVLQSLAIHRTERILAALLDDPEWEMVNFTDQVKGGGNSVPDAEIRANFHVLIETKTARGSLKQKRQLTDHLERFTGSPAGFERLIVLTPDTEEPALIAEINDPRVVWCRFSTLDDAITEMLDDSTEVISERESFLLRELQHMLAEDNLLDDPYDTVVVAAKKAFDDYVQLHAYVCQKDRTFAGASRIAFYRHNKIERLVPKILRVHKEVPRKENNGGPVEQLINNHIKILPDWRTNCQVLELSPPNATDTIVLHSEIPNDLFGKNGRRTAFTQGQRYVRSELLKVAKSTKDLIGAD